MGDVVKLHEQSLIENLDFITDFARYSEGILDEKFLRKKYRFDNATWKRLGEDDALIERIEDERLRRVRDGSSKRELAQKHIVKAPDVLSGIMNDTTASPKHRIDSAKVLDQFAANGPQGAPAADRFQIVINLGADLVETYDKSRAINPHDDPSEVASQDVVVAIAATKKDSADGQGYL